MVPGWDFQRAGDGTTSHVEWFRSSVGQVSLTWKDLGDVYIVEMPKDKSATGQHEMFSLFQDVRGVEVSINGKGVAGKPFPREFAGKKNSSTAFLAYCGDLGEGVEARCALALAGETAWCACATDRALEPIFPLPSRERVGVRGKSAHISPSPSPSP